MLLAMRPERSTFILAGLTLVITATAAVMVYTGKSSLLEGASVVTGALCVWLTVKENVWNFPLGLINVATFSVVFFRAQLYADAGLQVVYFILGVVGWYLWLYGGERKTALRVTLASYAERTIAVAATFALTLVLWRTLTLVGGSASFWDALTTSLSLAAQWLLNKKRLESWLFWITVDVIYVPLYIYKELYLTALLYAVFFVMATMGLMQWWATWKSQRDAAQTPTALEEAVS